MVQCPTPGQGKKSRDEAAEKFGIKGRQVGGAKMVRDKGVPELFEAVKRGEVGVQAGERVTSLQFTGRRGVDCNGGGVVM